MYLVGIVIVTRLIHLDFSDVQELVDLVAEASRIVEVVLVLLLH